MSLFSDFIKNKDNKNNELNRPDNPRLITTKNITELPSDIPQLKQSGKTSVNPCGKKWVTIESPVKVRAKISSNGSSSTITNPGADNVTQELKKDQKIMTKILENNKDEPLQDQYDNPVIFNDEIQMNMWGSGLVKDFIISTNQVWRCMYDIHILPIKNMFKIDLIDTKNTPLTRYVNYAKKIRDSQIRLPDWFIMSNGSKQQKIIPCYDTEIDFMGIVFIDSHSSRGKTMMMYHISESMIRNGMHVSDVISRNLFKAFGNLFCLNYIRRYITSPEQCFMIKDHYSSYYEHLKYGLLEQNLKRMILISPRQIFMIIKILKEMRSHLVDELLLINLKRGKIVQEILYDDKYYDMKRIFEKLWPKLELIVLMRQGSFRVHTERIRKYTGNIKLYCPTYALPEVTIGYDIENNNTYTIDPRKGYFEFIPIKDTSNVKSIRNLKIGDLYNLVVSTRSSDIQRYVTGEIVRVLGYFNGSPKIDIVCKEEDLINIKGSIITPQCIESILMKNFVLVDYCYRYTQLDKSDKLKIYIEIDEAEYLKEIDKVHDVKPHVKDIDILDHLLDHLGLDAEVRIVMPDTFDALYRNRYSDEIDPAMIQIPRLITNTCDTEILREKILYMF